MNFTKAGNRFGQYVNCDSEFGIIDVGDVVCVDKYYGHVVKVLYSSLSYLIIQCDTFTVHLEFDIGKNFGLFVLVTANADINNVLIKFYADQVYVPGIETTRNITHGISHLF